MWNAMTSVISDLLDPYYGVPSPTEYQYKDREVDCLNPIEMQYIPSLQRAELKQMIGNIDAFGDEVTKLGTISKFFQSRTPYFIQNALGLEDLKSPETVNQVAKMSLSEIANDYKLYDVCAYDLLAEKLKGLSLPDANVVLYKQYFDLREELRLATQLMDRRLDKIQKLYDANGKVLEEKLTYNTYGTDKKGNTTVEEYSPVLTPSWEQYSIARKFQSHGQWRLTEWVDWKIKAEQLVKEKYSEQVQQIDHAFQSQIDLLRIE